VDMKIEPFLIASSISGVIAQRLVRRICEKCKQEDQPSGPLLQLLKLPEGRALKTMKGAGCRHCQNTGYKGRIGIFEILKVTESVQKKIVEGASTSEIEAEARRAGFKSLRQDALDKIQAGLTTIEEVVKTVDLGVQ